MSLEDYRAAHARWLEWPDGDPIHSINGQLSQLMSQDAVFRTFKEARKDTRRAWALGCGGRSRSGACWMTR